MLRFLKNASLDVNREGRSDNNIIWVLTFLLLSLVAGIFAFSGTADDTSGLYGRVATIGFLMLAALAFLARRNHRNQ